MHSIFKQFVVELETIKIDKTVEIQRLNTGVVFPKHFKAGQICVSFSIEKVHLQSMQLGIGQIPNTSSIVKIQGPINDYWFDFGEYFLS